MMWRDGWIGKEGGNEGLIMDGVGMRGAGGRGGGGGGAVVGVGRL